MMKPRMIMESENGVAAIEFAIVLPLLLLLLFGIIEFSILLYDKAMITNASREGARAGIVYDFYDPSPDEPYSGDETYHPNNSEIIARVNQYLQDFLISFGDPDDDPDITITRRNRSSELIGYGEEEKGDSLLVVVDWTYDFLVLPNFMSGLVGDISSRAVMRFE